MKKSQPKQRKKQEPQAQSATYYSAARRRWICWEGKSPHLAHPKQRHLTANPEALVGSLLLLGSPAITKSNAAPQTALVTDVKWAADDEWFPTNADDGSTFHGWVVTLTASNPTAQEQLLGLYATALAIRQTATMDDVTARANFRWGVYPNHSNAPLWRWWLCLEERYEDGSFGFARTWWDVPELRAAALGETKYLVRANNPSGVSIPLGFLIGALDGLRPESTDTDEAAAAADPAACAAHANGFRLLPPTACRNAASP